MNTAGERILSTREWGESVKSVLTNKLVSSLFELDGEALGMPGVVAMLEEELRPFLALKAKVQSEQPEEEALRSTHEKLLELMKRSFMVTQQALLNRLQSEEEERLPGNQPPDQSPPDTDSGGKRLLEWYVTRMDDIGEQFLLALAEVAEKHKDIYDQLDLPVGATPGSSGPAGHTNKSSEKVKASRKRTRVRDQLRHVRDSSGGTH